MNLGNRIKFYRELRGISQSALARSSNISVNTIRKYENNTRNPKPEQLEKIADCLNISVHALKEIKISSIDDIAPYLFAIAETGGITFHGNKDDNGKYISDSLTFSFNSPTLKHFIKEWADKKEIIDKLRLDAQNTPDTQAKEYLLNRADEIEKEIELRMIDSQLFVDNKTKK